MPTPAIAFEPFEPLLDAEEVAPLLHLKPETVRTQARRGVLPAVRVGRSLRFRLSDITRALRPAVPEPEGP